MVAFSVQSGIANLRKHLAFFSYPYNEIKHTPNPLSTNHALQNLPNQMEVYVQKPRVGLSALDRNYPKCICTRKCTSTLQN